MFSSSSDPSGGAWFDTDANGINQMIATAASAARHNVSQLTQSTSHRQNSRRQRRSEKRSEQKAVDVSCRSYPETGIAKVDWALYAAKRVAKARRISLSSTEDDDDNNKPQSNVACIFLAAPHRAYRNADQRCDFLQSLTLESIILAEYKPQRFLSHLKAISSVNVSLKHAFAQCAAQYEQCCSDIERRAAENRDYLIKKMLFNADNGKESCELLLDVCSLFGNRENVVKKWPAEFLKSVEERDLFGRAVSTLVEQVLQSSSLRVYHSAAQSSASSVCLTLSWSEAFKRLTQRDKEEKQQKISAKPAAATVSSERVTRDPLTTQLPSPETTKQFLFASSATKSKLFDGSDDDVSSTTCAAEETAYF